MKVAFPVQQDQGLESSVHGHFGSAPGFVVVESETGSFETLTNNDMHHSHGQCQPMKALSGNTVDAVVVGGIGAGALRKLQADGVRVFRAVEGSLQENLEFIKAGKLPEFVMNMTCAEHHGQESCVH
jgi:predicted Fe-Mo cluster-binding NifX family protein